MPIIEFVHLTLPPPHTTTSGSLLSTIAPSCQVMGAASGFPSIFFSDLTDESKMYVIGGWHSQEAHQKGFNGSAEQGKLIEGIKGVMEIEWMEYFDIPITEVGKEGRLDKKCVVAVIWDCGDSISEDEKRVVGNWFKEMGGGDEVTGWNLKKKEKENEDSYLVLFEGFEALEEGKVMGGRLMKEMEEMKRGEQVKVVYMRRIDVEGNGRVS